MSRANTLNLERPIAEEEFAHVLELVRKNLKGTHSDCILDFSWEFAKKGKQYTAYFRTKKPAIIFQLQSFEPEHMGLHYAITFLPSQKSKGLVEPGKQVIRNYLIENTLPSRELVRGVHYDRVEDAVQELQARTIRRIKLDPAIEFSELERLLCIVKDHAKKAFDECLLDYSLISKRRALFEPSQQQAIPRSVGVAVEGTFRTPRMRENLDFYLEGNAENAFSEIEFERGLKDWYVLQNADKQLASLTREVIHRYFFAKRQREKHPLLYLGLPDVKKIDYSLFCVKP